MAIARGGAMILGSLGPQWIENRAPTTKAATQV